ncbi:MAG: hypothetical protein ACKVHE_17075 [Planctomycetales bacterium]|jgi:hypothetical protein
MNAFGLALVWVSLQVSVLCLVAMAVYLIARRGSSNAGAEATLSGLLLVVLLSAAAPSPWPRWSYGEPAELADTEAVAGTSASPVVAADGEALDGGTTELLTTADLDDGSSKWYSAESTRQFWIALREAPATAVRSKRRLRSTGAAGWRCCFWLVPALPSCGLYLDWQPSLDTACEVNPSTMRRSSN